MFNWAKQQLANVAGTQEPIYGASAIASVAEQCGSVPYTELGKEDLRWATLESTSVETQTFYVMAETGHLAMAQVIYSNVAGIRITCQFNTKIFYPDRKQPTLWSADALENYGFDDGRLSFYADDVAVTLSEDGTQYTIKSAVNEDSIVNLAFTRTAPGFQVGKNGTTSFGTDPEQPWGSMRHAFWPRNRVEGSIITKAGELDFEGRGSFVYALQGMKPHHAAARWNFVDFQSPAYSAVMMEYTTPPSYGSTVVNVGGIVRHGEIVFAGASSTATHTQIDHDDENDWPQPGAVEFVWDGSAKDGGEVHATLAGALGDRLDRVDVMAEVPGFVKSIVGGVAGTRPYIYQFSAPMTLTLDVGGDKTEEEGRVFCEAVFIS